MKRFWSIIPIAGPQAYTLSAVMLIASLAISGTSIYVALAAPLNAPFTPSLVSFEGQLADSEGNPVLDSPTGYELTFNLYDEPSGSHDPVWFETQPVTVKQGLYNVLLGSSTTLPPNAFDGPRWLGVQINGGAEITPRVSIGSVPFALNARQAQGLQSYPIAATTPLDGQVLSFNAGQQWSPANPPPTVPSARVRRTGNPTMAIVHNIWTAVTFDTVRWDSGSMFNPSLNTRLTAPQAGKYLISGSIAFPGDLDEAEPPTQRGVRITWTTGTTTTIIAFDFRNAPLCESGGCLGPIRLNISTVYALNANDYVELWVYQDANVVNTNLSLVQAGNYAPEFEMIRVGD